MVEEESNSKPVEDVDVKNSSEPYVSYFNPKRGYGFLYEVSSQKQYFFHISQVKNIQTIGGNIQLFDKVLSYEVGKSPKDGREQAINVVFKAREESEEGEVLS